MIHSIQLVDQMPTRSPRRMPMDHRPRATRSAASLSSLHVMRLPWCMLATASRSGMRSAVRVSRLPMVSSSRGRAGPRAWLLRHKFSSTGIDVPSSGGGYEAVTKGVYAGVGVRLCDLLHMTGNCGVVAEIAQRLNPAHFGCLIGT